MNLWRHIYPADDENDHDTSVETGKECPCGPEIDWDDCLVFHSSFDGGEIVEQAAEILNQNQK